MVKGKMTLRYSFSLYAPRSSSAFFQMRSASLDIEEAGGLRVISSLLL